MEESLGRELHGAGLNAAYDGHAKRLLAHRIVLAHILVNAVSEFAGMEPEDVAQLIEREPEISAVPVGPGETRDESGNLMPAIAGGNTESLIPYEGKVTYDIRFFAWAPGKKERMKIFLDVEAQKKEFKISVGPDLERRISIMCNLSEAIAEEGLEKGREEGREEGMEQLIASFLKNDNHVSHAVKMLGVPEEMVLSVAQKERIEILQ